MKVAIVGSGGREHVMAWKLAQTVPGEQILLLPGNGGTTNNFPVDPSDLDAVKAFCIEEKVELVLVGPEGPLAEGIVDRMADTSIRVFGPSQGAARLEASKIWSKRFMQRHGVATAACETFEDLASARRYAHSLDGNVVVKYDGLAAGKGVFVCQDVQEADGAFSALKEKYGPDAATVVEEPLIGSEISIIGVTDGETVKLLQPSQDHKQLEDADRGPNTGGMGSFCPVPACDAALLDQIDRAVVGPTIEGLQAEKLEYRGVIYFGLMITRDGPKLLEYNVRFGDPEAEVVLPALESDLLELVEACFDGSLARVEPELEPGFFVDVVLASGGYPGSYGKGYEIHGVDQAEEGALVFHSGTRREGSRLLTAGGRVLNVVARGDTLEEAIDRAYEGCGRIRFEGMYHRSDIGRRDWTR